MKKIIGSVVCLVLVFVLAACAPATQAPTTQAPATQAPATQAPATPAPQPVVLTFFTQHPDRTTGDGLVEQTLMDRYTQENPNVTFKLEALTGDPWTAKFNAYVASNSLPDILFTPGMKSFLGPMIDAKLLVGMNPSDYASYGFLPGELESVTYNGKVYGLPKGLDVMMLYYNQALFTQYNVKVPTTVSELLQAAKTFRANGVVPLAMPGKDGKWVLAALYQQLAWDLSGNKNTIYDAVDQKITFAGNADLLAAANLVKQMVDGGVFQDGFIATDYGTSKSLFVQGKAAMWYMGTWELGLASDKNNDEVFRNSVHVTFPPFADGGKGQPTDVVGWGTASYSVAVGPHQAEAVKFLNYFLLPENRAKLYWQGGYGVPAQKFAQFNTGQETVLQNEVAGLLDRASGLSGPMWIDMSTPTFKQASEDLSQELFAGIVSPQDFLTKSDANAAAK